MPLTQPSSWSGSLDVTKTLADPTLPASKREEISPRYLAALSLAEGETIRRILHSRQPVLDMCAIALRTIDGQAIDMSVHYYPEATPEKEAHDLVTMGLQCLKFINCEMYYSDKEIEVLEHALCRVSLQDRKVFFLENLRLRRRERNIWEDTPLAKLFVPSQEWHLLRTRAMIEKIGVAVRKAIRRRAGTSKFNPYTVFDKWDANGEGSLGHEQMLEVMAALNLDFSPGDYHQALQLFPKENGKITRTVFQSILMLPSESSILDLHQVHAANKGIPPSYWQCPNDTFLNPPDTTVCLMCGLGATGRYEPGRDQWGCITCSLFNNVSDFFCSACGHARPDYAHLRF